MRRRVVVTGLGWVTPLGAEAGQVWDRLVNGQSAIGPITLFDAKSFPVRIAAEVPDGCIPPVRFDSTRLHPRQTSFAVAAATGAVRTAGLDEAKINPLRFGVYLGCGETFPDFQQFGQLVAAAMEKAEFGPDRFLRQSLENGHAVTQLRSELNLPACYLAGMFDAQGPHANCTAACVSSTQAVGEAAQLIRHGQADLMLCGGAHSMIHPFGLTGLQRLSVLSTRNDLKAMRPFDRNRDGFVVGEGAAMLILEELTHARKRNANIWAELTGYASTQNAFRITDSHPEGRGCSSCISQALDDARLNVDQIDYLNAHGTSTVENDKVETLAIKRAFGRHAPKVPISSTKSMLGHLTTACGAVELMACLMSLASGVIHPTINYETPDPECDLDYVPNTAREVPLRHVLSNSFGFGGQNVALIVSRY